MQCPWHADCDVRFSVTNLSFTNLSLANLSLTGLSIAHENGVIHTAQTG
ncbi:MAG: hypothetical protein NTU59_03790 [Coprothermobacterota bacterium]|nr:hypothetical protein [Coprothermobacterota bacterium]